MKEYSIHILRGLILLVLQIVVFMNIGMEVNGFNYLVILLYPLAFILLPFNIPATFCVIASFVYGLFIDVFYLSPGVHASALLFMAYARIIVIKWLEPRGGYSVNQAPTLFHMGYEWTIRYLSILFLLHHFWYFMMVSFTLFYLSSIIIHTVLSTIVSVILTMVYSILFNPKS